MRYVLALAAAAALLAPPAGAAPRPQVTDPAGDAHVALTGLTDTTLPVGSQDYADGTSLAFATTRQGRRVTGFTVTMTLTAPPAPPGGTVAVYRAYAWAPGCFLWFDWYTAALGDAPQAGVGSVCGNNEWARRALAGPRVQGTAITWTVPLAALPARALVRPGTTLTELHFETYLRPHAALCTGGDGVAGQESSRCVHLLDNMARHTATYTVR